MLKTNSIFRNLICSFILISGIQITKAQSNNKPADIVIAKITEDGIELTVKNEQLVALLVEGSGGTTFTDPIIIQHANQYYLTGTGWSSKGKEIRKAINLGKKGVNLFYPVLQDRFEHECELSEESPEFEFKTDEKGKIVGCICPDLKCNHTIQYFEGK